MLEVELKHVIRSLKDVCIGIYIYYLAEDTGIDSDVVDKLMLDENNRCYCPDT